MSRSASNRTGPGGYSLRALTFIYLAILVGLPLLAAGIQLFKISPAEIWHRVTNAEAFASIKLSVYAAAVASFINCFFGLIIAWVLTRYPFPMRRFADALVDLPFAIPGVVAGIALMALYGPNAHIGQLFSENGSLGKWFISLGLQPPAISGTFLGLVIADLFVTLPFVVRTIQPAIAELEPEAEEAASILGANSIKTFVRVLFPPIFPAIVTGFGLAFARGVNEYGIIVLISGNVPYDSLVAPVYVYQRIESNDYPGASAVAMTLLLISLVVLSATFLWNRWSLRHVA